MAQPETPAETSPVDDADPNTSPDEAAAAGPDTDGAPEDPTEVTPEQEGDPAPALHDDDGDVDDLTGGFADPEVDLDTVLDTVPDIDGGDDA